MDFDNKLRPKHNMDIFKELPPEQMSKIIVKARQAVENGEYPDFTSAVIGIYPTFRKSFDNKQIVKRPKTNGFNKWLDTFISEKGIDPEESFDLEGESGTNMMNYGVILDHMKSTTPQEQAKLKDMIVKLDFKNADIRDYLRHLGKAIVK